MSSINKLFWQWIFNPSITPSHQPAINPIICDKLFKAHHSILLLTAIRRRGLFLRRTHGTKGRALMALMELNDI